MRSFLQSPYFDDYDENKKFHRILYRPSIPVQARELNQMQAIIQEQVKRLGDHSFKDGAKIVDGQLSFDTSIRYVRLQSNDYDVTQFIGTTATGQTSGAKAYIVTATNAEGSDPATLFVKFQSSGEDTNTQEFERNEQIVAEGMTVSTEDSDTFLDSASIAQIERGVYYIFGNFVLVDAQTIILEKYSNAPTYRVGLDARESIVTPEEDESLLDNANGSYNYNAPGAHRYRIDPVLVKVPLDSDEIDNFIELGQIVEGQIVKLVSTTEYSELEKTLARRTYDESGDYTVRPFRIDVCEHRSNDRGQWKPNTKYRRGDIVRSNSKSYVARTSGTSANSSYTPKHDSGTKFENSANSSGIKWERVSAPELNGGIYNAEGSIDHVDVISGGSGYSKPPTIEAIGGGGSGAVLKAVVSGGQVIKIMVMNGGLGYTSNDITLSIRGDGEGCDAKAVANFGEEDKLAVGLERGKAYVQGFEIEKVGTTYLSVPKARTTLSSSDTMTTTRVGNFVNVTNLCGIPSFSSMPTIDIYDQMTDASTADSRKNPKGSKIGTCRVRGIEWASGTVNDADRGVYRLYISDIDLVQGKSFARDVKSFFMSRGAGNFTANIAPIETTLSGTISVSGTTVSGVGTSFNSELKVGDYIGVLGYIRRVESIASQSSMTISEAIGHEIGGQTYSRITTTVSEPQNVSNLIQLASSYTKIVTDSDVKYWTMEQFESTAQGVGGAVTVTFRTNAGEFASEYENDNYILSCPSTGEIIEPEQVANNKTTITFTIDPKFAGLTILAMCTVAKTGSNSTLRRSKVVRSMTFTVTDKASVQAKSIGLKQADAFRIVSVKMSDKEWGTVPTESDAMTDITDRYDLNDGQTETVYGISSIVLKNGYNPPSGPIRIEFEYFAHTNGDYFTVDSYPEEIDYGDIPSFNGTNLRDCIDFRPRMNANGTVTGGRSLKRGTEIYAGCEYYVGRKDRICLSYTGDFVLVSGNPGLNPQYPEVPNMAMNLYNLDIKPYTFGADADSVKVETVDNRRYTMRDIGKLEKRISNLEDYTTLSLLEQQTANMSITDSDGYDRFKQGFVVDNFKDGTLLSQSDDNLNVALDTENGIARPPFVTKSVSLTEKVNRDSDRANNGYKAYGKVFTLALDSSEPHKVLVQQDLASKTESVNPFAVATFLGTVKVNPSSDTWFDEEYLPDVVNNVEGNYEKLKATEGTKWNDWQTTWTGATKAVNSWYKQNTYWDFRIGHNMQETTTTTTYAQSHGETRSGLKTSVTARIDYEEVGDKVVSISEIPYMRSRYLLVKAKGLKPNTRFYPFFDDVSVDYWCTPASVVEYTPTNSAVFDDSTMTDEREETARIIEKTRNSLWSEPTDKTCLDIGDVISSNNLTAVVVGRGVDYSDSENPRYFLYVVNIKRRDGTTVDGRYYSDGKYVKNANAITFNTGDSIVGSISGATGTVVSAEENMNHIHDPIVTNAAGEVQFLFWIPNSTKMDYASIDDEKATAALTFRTGERTLRVNDNAENLDTASNSSAEGIYTATGILNTRQKTVNAVRNAQVVSSLVTENKTVTNTWQQTTFKAENIDPLAQTFFVDCKGGCFLSKVDVFFSSKDDSLPVTLQIRPVVNGYPSGQVLSFSEVTKNPEDVKISSTKVSYEDDTGKTVTASADDMPTTFEFESPVYVEDGEQYAIVLLSNSVKYRVWIAEVGGVVPNRSTVISKQPYNGVLFKSQNASTWTANQNQDLKFTLYRANFDTNAVANVEFVNGTVPYSYLKTDPFQTVKGKPYVRIWKDNSGFTEGSVVRFKYENPNDLDSGSKTLTGRITTGSDPKIKGTGTKFTSEVSVGDALYHGENCVGVVKSIESDTELTLHDVPFVFMSLGEATRQASVNGIPVTAFTGREHTVVSADLHSYVIELNETETAKASGYAGGRYFMASSNLRYDLLQPSVTYQAFSDTPIEFQFDGLTDAQNGLSRSQVSNEPINVNENNEFTTPMCVYSSDNVGTFGTSLTLRAKFSSSNPALSPVIDSDRVSAVVVSNMIDNPEILSSDIADLDSEELTGCEFKYSGGVSEVLIGSGGRDYTAAKVVFGDPELPGGVAATGTAVVSGGQITKITVTDGGCGYTKAPTCTVTSSTGSGFTANQVHLNQNQIFVTTSDKASSVEVGKYLEIGGSSANSGIAVVKKITNLESAAVFDTSRTFDLSEDASGETLTLRTLYTDETAPLGGTVTAKYITKTVSLSGLCDYLRIVFSASVPVNSGIEVYRKTFQSNGAAGYEGTEWIRMDPNSSIRKTDIGADEFADITFEAEDLESFDSLAVKIVFRSSVTTAVPKIRDLRIVACA